MEEVHERRCIVSYHKLYDDEKFAPGTRRGVVEEADGRRVEYGICERCMKNFQRYGTD